MKISFIIPAFNASATLDRCLESIFDQSFSDYEVIVIDDGSTDDTGEIAQRRAREDARIHVHTRENGGQGAARNFGVSVAKGDWIWFVDSDDWLIDESLVRIAAILSRHDPDVLVANFEFAFDDKPPQPSSVVPPKMASRIVDARQDASTFASLSCWATPPWRLISRRALLVDNGVRFAQGVFYEDHPFAIEVMLRAERVFVDAPISYAYYQRADSTTHISDRRAFDFIPVRRICIDLLKSNGVYERFASVAAGYIAPVNFYEAHVGAEFRKEFLEKLDADLEPTEEQFARQHGIPATGPFLDMVRRRAPRRAPNRQLARLGRLLTADGRQRLRARVLASARFRAGRLINRARQLALGPQSHAGIDHTGRRFLRVGENVRIEQIMIDVRVEQEDRPYVVVGDDSHIGGHYVFERGTGQITIGSRSSIGGGCLLICSQDDGIRIGSNVMLSWSVTVTDTDAHSLDPAIRHNDAYDWKCGADSGRIGTYKDWSNVRSVPVTIEDGAWVGFGAAILKGVTIGQGAIVGAHSVVTRDVAPFTIVGGNPARFIRLAPRQHWSWEDIVHALQGDPRMHEALKASYLHPDFTEALRGYRESEEFRDTAATARELSPSPRTMLDVGCGNGVTSVAFALEGFEVTALEPSTDDLVGTEAIARMIDEGRKFDETVGARVKIVPGSIETADIQPGFDFVLCRQVTHHFQDPVVALRFIRRLVNPDGVVLLVREHVVFDEADRERFLETHPMHRYYGGENAYSVDEYVDIARQAGFVVERTLGFKDSPINYYPHTVDVVRSINEADVPGRPYTFVLKPFTPESAGNDS